VTIRYACHLRIGYVRDIGLVVGTTKRYAAVSCHVERLLDDEVWTRYRAFVRSSPGGFRVASLVRPPDSRAGESERFWVGRARELAKVGPLGHHTHWTSPTHARPTEGDTGERVRREGVWLREQGLEPTLFVGGGWYTDAAVAAACAELGYADCTPRATRPPYLGEEDQWAELSEPRRVDLPDGGSLLALPTTHSIGDVLRRGWRSEGFVHVYFHDTDLLRLRRRLAVGSALRLLGATSRVVDLDAVRHATVQASARWSEIARGKATGQRK
jgi:hypothetical protein